MTSNATTGGLSTARATGLPVGRCASRTSPVCHRPNGPSSFRSEGRNLQSVYPNDAAARAAEQERVWDVSTRAQLGWRYSGTRSSSAPARVSITTIDEMSGTDFEKYVADIFRRNGWDVSGTRATADYGVDLIAERDDRRVAVQCKRLGIPVGIDAVQQVVSGAAHYHCNASMVVSNQEFTRAATVLARSNNCELLGRSTMNAIIFICE